MDKKYIIINIKNKEHKVFFDKVTPETSLNHYLRKILKLSGTKKMCLEGGCGACVVVAHRPDLATGGVKTVAINSCLVSVLSCNNWTIETVDTIGGPPEKYHPVQDVLAKFYGTQCGYCSPGMVMNMYALYETGKLTLKDVENSFGGNICRCTGYRPILAAFKSLCKNACKDDSDNCTDIEDLIYKKERCRISSDSSDWILCNRMNSFRANFETGSWIAVTTLSEILDIIKTAGNKTYMLVAGNTAKGVYRTPPFDIYINILQVEELTGYEFKNGNLILGANMSFTDTMDLFDTFGENNPDFAYLKQMARHIDLIANVPVRNMGTLAGNLMTKYQHNEFPSDVFLIFETFGAILTVVNCNNIESKLTLVEFLEHDMRQNVLKSIALKKLSNDYMYVTYKILPRAQNVHALVNAGFRFQFNSNTISAASIVIGNINPSFTHAFATESYLIGKNLFDNQVLQTALQILANELNPDIRPPEPEPQFRKQLALSLFYKAVLFLAPPEIVSDRNKSGGFLLERSISSGTQDYSTDKELFPITQPIPKIESLDQTSGRTEYVDDIPDLPHQLYGKLVLAKNTPSSTIDKIDASKALALEGVVAFYTKDDIPGDNNYIPFEFGEGQIEEIFSSGTIKMFDQPIGVIVAYSEDIATKAVDLVEVSYTPPKTSPIITNRDAIKAGQKMELKLTMTATERGEDIAKVIKGTFDINWQYHFHMETQCCLIVPIEETLEAHCSSQALDLNQIAIARMLDIPNTKVNLRLRRCGGAFGAKAFRNAQISCAASLAAWKLKKPVRMSFTLQENMRTIGKRFPFSCNYEVGVNKLGVIQYMDVTGYSNQGIAINENIAVIELIEAVLRTMYKPDVFNVKVYIPVTNTAANTAARGPGSVEGRAFMEAIMEHISYEINVDPIDVRLRNFTDFSPLPDYLSDLIVWADIYQRKKDIIQFNQENRWKKKGLTIIPSTFQFKVFGALSTVVSIYHGDGSVAITHGGIEMGQGVNTKAVQVCAYKLGISMNKITVRPTDTSVNPSSSASGASMVSEGICYGVIKACDELLKRIEPYKTPKNDTWEKIIQDAFSNNVHLSASATYSPSEPFLGPYEIHGVCATEVILDVLTGQTIISRVDLIEDVGRSINPFVDIGQIEGAFVMGQGYHTTEDLKYSPQAEVLTDSTWYYYPPGAKDIPVDFRIKLHEKDFNPIGVLQSKAVGEPPILLSFSVPLAIRNAVASARKEADSNVSAWYPIDGPSTVENTFMHCLNDYKNYTL